MVLLVIVAVAGWVLGRMALRWWRGVEVTEVEATVGRVVAAVYATGRVDTDRRATLRARVAAPLEELLVGAGEAVTAGQVVARQDGEVLRLARERAEREMEAGRAALAQAEDAARRAEQLAADRLLPEEELVKARERANQLRAELAAQEAAWRLAAEQERWGVLRSPMAGVVAGLHHRAGDPLREGDEVVTVVDLAPAYLRVAVDERDLGRIREGQEVRIAFDAFPETLLTGSVWRIVPSLDRLTKSVDVLVRLPEQRPPLRLDLTATVNIVTEVVEAAVVLPRDALGETGGSPFVMAVGEDRRAVRRPVRLGPCDATRCQILQGVAAGERVISPLASSLAEGARVHRR
jgi:RND family efflux transporter MFP subunit